MLTACKQCKKIAGPVGVRTPWGYNAIVTAGRVESGPTGRRLRVLFVSEANAARSQIAAAWLREIGGDQFDSQSAGIDPSSELDADAILVMREVGIDLPANPPRSTAGLSGEDYDLIVVLRPRGEQDVVPVVGIPEVMHWSFAPLADRSGADPRERLGAARRMRDEIRTRVALLVNATRR